MILYINSVDMQAVTYTLIDNKKIIVSKTYSVDSHQSHEMFSRFQESGLLRYKDKIEKIVVNTGPGSFTGVRVGTAHAQALSMALGIPLKEVSDEDFQKSVSM